MKKFVSAMAVFASLTAFGSIEASAGIISAPSVTGAATLADLTGGGGDLLSDRVQVFGPTGGAFANKGVTDAQVSACGTGNPANGLFNLFGAGLNVANACEFGLADHSIVTALPYNIAVNSALENKPTLVYEPDGVTLSDVFGIRCEDVFNGGQGGCYLVFLSRIGNQPFIIPSDVDTSGWYSVTELAGGLGTVFDMTIYLDPTFQSNSSDTVRFISANEVPEPATLGLFGAGFAGLTAMLRRKKASKK